ncbi:DUF1329 domain-containing protein [Pseudomonas sp. TTU2014-080ASC]|jgi:hypothetical protein|uniref:DUF1329 domain-containing protein n=1 Tax=Pseudomonas sp. TTU2014-080ASC TaxID=1729724 RepID=UPI0007184B15|nr:DUF1329 domain-containing protein [Pseudomonas sp. TTU2014-080ASC]KRW62657.1 hypothetical protein AO726_04365 [Pseudomonas sp. TTU2014-080ASC]
MKTTTRIFASLTLSLMTSSVLAAASPDEIAKLGTSLTPIGAERGANADGSIPEWTGGLTKSAGSVDAKGFLSNPFADEQPLFVITAQNAEQYRDKLNEGQLAMFKRYPETFKMKVYPSHRTVSMPQAIYDAARVSAANVKLVDGGNGLDGFAESRVFPFPIPKSGIEVVWNHLTRYKGGNVLRDSSNGFPQRNGEYTLVRMTDQVAFPSWLPDMTKDKAENTLLVFKSVTTAPARLAGNVLLVHDTLNQVKEARMAWQYNPGQRRVRRAPQVAYDSPGNNADGTRASDDFDMYNGAPDRYDWKLIGKKELYIPYNSYDLASPSLKYSDILKVGHVNQDLARYELHRVWVVEGTLKDGKRHVYAKRRFYIDEDSWTIAASELYDGRGQLWRVGQAMLMQEYNAQTPWYALEALYDLISGRYGVYGMINEEAKWIRFGVNASSNDYTPAALRTSGVR